MGLRERLRISDKRTQFHFSRPNYAHLPLVLISLLTSEERTTSHSSEVLLYFCYYVAGDGVTEFSLFCASPDLLGEAAPL